MRHLRLLSLGLFVALAAPGRATDYTWTNAAGGTYTTATNWSGGVVPTATDNATINLGGTYTVTLGSTTAVNNLTLNSASLNFSHTAATYTVGGTILLTAGTYNLNGGTISGGAVSTGGGSGRLKFGTSTNSTLNNVQIGAGALDFSTTGGRIRFTGGTNFTAASSYSLAGSFIFDVNQTQAIDNLSLVLGNSSFLRAVGTSGLTIGATSTVTFSGTSAVVGTSAAGFPLVNNGVIQNTGTGSLNLQVLSTMSNTGTIRQTTTGILNIGTSTGTVTNQATGLIDVQAGTANFLGTFLNTGTVKVGAGATVNLSGNHTSSLLGQFDRGGTLPVAGTNGTVQLTGGSTVGLTLSGTLDLHTSTGTLLLNNGSISGDGNTLTSSGASRLIATTAGGGSNFNYLDNVVVGAGVLDLSPASGRLFLTGGTTFAAGAAATTGGLFDLRVDQTAPVDNLALTLGDSALLRAGGANGMTLGPNTTVAYGGPTGATISTLNLAWAVTNQGTIRNTGTGTLNVGFPNVASTVTNEAGGLIDAQAGTVSLASTFVNAGTVKVANGATVSLAGNYTSSALGRFDRGGTAPVAGSNGTVQLIGGSTFGLTLTGSLDLHTSTGPLLLNNGTINGAGNTLSTSGTSRLVATTAAAGFNYINNAVLGVGVLDLSTSSGRLLLQSGTTFAVGSTYTTGTSFDLRVDQTQAIDNLVLTLGNSALLRAAGTNGLTLGPNSVVTYGGTGSAIILSTNAIPSLTNQGVIQNTGAGTLSVIPTSTLANSGTIRNTSTGAMNVGSVVAPFVNQTGGLIDAQAGTTNLDGTFTNNGTVRVANGATLNLVGVYSSGTLGRFDRGGTAPVAGSNGIVQLAGGLTAGLTLTGNLDLHTSTGPLLLNNGTINGAGNTLTSSDATATKLVATAAGGGGNFNYLSNVVVDARLLDLSTVSGRLQLQGGTTFVAGPAYTTATTFDFRVDQTQPVNNLDLFLGNSATLRSAGTNGMTLGSSTTVTYAGTTSAAVGTMNAAFAVTNQGLLQNLGTGVLNINPTSTLTNSGTIRNTSTGFLNAGSGVVAFVNQVGGIIAADNGTVNLDGTLTNNGTLRVTGGTLNLGGAYLASTLGRFDRGGTAPVAGGNGTVALTGGLATGLTLDGPLDLVTSTGPLQLNNGTIFGNGNTLSSSVSGTRLVATATAGGSNFNYLSNVVVGVGVLDLSTASGRLQLQGGTTFAPGAIATAGTSFDLRVDQTQPVNNLALILNNSATLRAGGANGMTLGSSTTVTYAGTTSATVGTLNAAFGVTNQGTIRNTGTGTLNVNPVSTLSNAGTIANQGTGLTIVGGGTLTLTNSGRLEATGGTLRVPDTVTFTNFVSGVLTGGTYLASNGGVIDLGTRQITSLDISTNIVFGPSGGSFPNLAGLNEVRPGATLNLLSSFNFVGSVVNNGSFIIEGGTVAIPGTLTNGGVLTVRPGGVLQGSQNITVNPGGRLTVLGSGRVSVPTTRAIIVEGGLGNPGVLSGTGTVEGRVQVKQNGRLQPGTSPGVITITNGLEMGGTYEWELNGNTNAGPGVNFDTVMLPAGNLQIESTATVAVRLTNVDFTDPFWASGRTWALVVLDNGSIVNQFTTAPTIIEGPDPTGYGTFGYEYLTLGSGSQLNLVWSATPVPEANMMLAFVGAVLAAGFAVRRRATAA